VPIEWFWTVIFVPLFLVSNSLLYFERWLSLFSSTLKPMHGYNVAGHVCMHMNEKGIYIYTSLFFPDSLTHLSKRPCLLSHRKKQLICLTAVGVGFVVGASLTIPSYMPYIDHLTASAIHAFTFVKVRFRFALTLEKKDCFIPPASSSVCSTDALCKRKDYASNNPI
jgi:hypothetical protein